MDVITEGRIEVAKLGSGFAAIHTVLVNGEYRDIQQTGGGRYRERDKAVADARIWSEMDGIPLSDDLKAGV